MPGKQKRLPYSKYEHRPDSPVSLQQIRNDKVFFLQWRNMSVDNYHPTRWRESESSLSNSFPEPPSSLHFWVNPPANTGNVGGGFDPWVRKIPWRRKWQPTSSILAWRIPGTEEPGGLHEVSESDITGDARISLGKGQAQPSSEK